MPHKFTTQTKRHASDDRNREACLSSWGMPLGRNKELLYKVCKYCLPGILLVVVVRQASFARCFSASEACGSAVYEGGGAGSESDCKDAFVDGGQV